MKIKSFCPILLIIPLMAFCISCSAQTEAQKNIKPATNQINQNKTQVPLSPSKPTVTKEIDISRWKIYRDTKNGFSFRYPPNLILQKKGNIVRLYHFIKYRYQEPCGFEEESAFLEKLIDFDVTFRIANKDFSKEDWGDYGMLSPSERPKLAGTVEGKYYMKTSHFCGHYEYIFPFKQSKSLIIEHQITGYLYKMAYSEAEKTKAWNNPDVIKPEEAASILGKIIESFEIL